MTSHSDRRSTCRPILSLARISRRCGAIRCERVFGYGLADSNALRAKYRVLATADRRHAWTA